MNDTGKLQVVNEKEAARLLGYSVKTLQNRRYLGLAPKFIKMGTAVRYRLADLEAYLDACTVLPRMEQYA